QITGACKNLPRIDAALASKAALILYRVPNITSENFWILPQDVLIPGDVADSLSVRACRGEYEPASLLIQPLRNIDHLTIAASDLVGADGRRIGADQIDIKYVKVWYQAGGAGKSINYSNGEILTPELLVNDPELVRVDEQQKKDFLKLTFPNETRYVDISDHTKIDHKVYKNSEFPVKDAPRLQPVNLTKMHNQQLWITVHVPEDAVPGNYTGSIKLSAAGGPLAEVGLRVEVLPFRLLPPYYTASIDYHGSLDKDGTISSRGKTHEQMLAELKDMRAHGLTNVQHYFEVTPESLSDVMALRKAAGFSNDTLYLKGHRIYFLTDKPADIDKIRRQVRTIIDMAQKLGAKEVYLYGRDEETGKMLNLQRKAWEAAREEGAKIFVAGQRDNAEFMADIQDVHIKAGWPDDDVSAKIHAHGNRIFMYSGPMAGIENPAVYRRNYGLIMYKHGYDGIADNAYQHTFGAIWNDFDHNIYRAHSFTYPTADGVIDTIAWEGYREAIDDVRYLTTLEAALKQAKARSGKTAKLETAVNDAEQFLSRIKNTRMVESTNPDQIRNQAIDLILALQ
ncbi:MAG: hypothetical protein AB7F32_13410, partial [Victivallaceae bacterium]